MTNERPRLEVADVIREFAAAYHVRHPVSLAQARVLRRLASCRTAALGGHRDTCVNCGVVKVSYNSCRDRHCPKCQAGKPATWLEERLDRLLAVPYFHVVFTVPDLLHPVMWHAALQARLGEHLADRCEGFVVMAGTAANVEQ